MRMMFSKRAHTSGRRGWATTTATTLMAALPLAAALTAVGPVGPAGATVVPAQTPTVTCTGDGSGADGNRVEVLYLHEPGKDRFVDREPAIRQALWETQQNINDSARREGAQRWLRYVHQASWSNCQPTITNLEVEPGTMGQDWDVINKRVADLGYNAPRRIYLLLNEGYSGCGNTDPSPIHSPGAGRSNPNNSLTIYSRVNMDCLSGHVVTHELTHALGALSNHSPNAIGDNGGHCTDGQEIMCQNTTTLACPDPNAIRLLDCGNDDYFAVVAQEGSWLADHWNIATDSDYLENGPDTPAISEIPPLPPQYLSLASVSGTDAVLSFLRTTSATQGITDYQIMRGVNVVATIPAHQATYHLTGLSPNHSYSYTVRTRSVVDGVERFSRHSPSVSFSTNTSTTSAAAPADDAIAVLVNEAAESSGRPYALELLNSSLEENARTVIYHRDYGFAQRWRLRSNDGAYNLVNKTSNKCLSVRDGSMESGAGVVQNACSSTDTAQRWEFTSISDNKYQLKSVHSGLCTQSRNGSTSEFTDVVQSSCSSTEPTQRWSFERLS